MVELRPGGGVLDIVGNEPARLHRRGPATGVSKPSEAEIGTLQPLQVHFVPAGVHPGHVGNVARVRDRAACNAEDSSTNRDTPTDSQTSYRDLVGDFPPAKRFFAPIQRHYENRQRPYPEPDRQPAGENQ